MCTNVSQVTRDAIKVMLCQTASQKPTTAQIWWSNFVTKSRPSASIIHHRLSKSRVADSCVYYLEETHFQYLHLSAFYHALRPQTAFSFFLLLKSFPHQERFVTFRCFIITKKNKNKSVQEQPNKHSDVRFLVFVTFKVPGNCSFPNKPCCQPTPPSYILHFKNPGNKWAKKKQQLGLILLCKLNRSKSGIK